MKPNGLRDNPDANRRKKRMARSPGSGKDQFVRTMANAIPHPGTVIGKNA